MAFKKGFFSIYNTGTMLRFAVDVKPNYVGLAVFEVPDPNFEVSDLRDNAVSFLSWSEIKQYLDVPPFEAFKLEGQEDPIYKIHDNVKSGSLDLRLNGVYVDDFPGSDAGAIYKGRSYVYSDGMTGLDELTDYGIVDIMTDAAGFPTVWRNRFALTKNERISTSFRWRSVTENSNALVVFMPFDTGSFEDTRIEVLCDVDPILLNGTTLKGRVDDSTIPNDGLYYVQWFYNAASEPATVSPDSTVEVPFSLVWNNDSTAVNREVQCTVSCDSGYLPKTKVTTDASGRGTVKFNSLGLEAGDVAYIKIGVGHFTNIGKLKVSVE